MSKVFVVNESYSGKRIDSVVTAHLAYSGMSVSRSDVSQSIRTGEILVNGKSVKPMYRVRVNDCIAVDIETGEREEIKPNSAVSVKVLFEDKWVLAVNKSAGVQVHPSALESRGTVANWICAVRPEIIGVGEDPIRPGIVHRLDKDTSGVLAIAKNQRAFFALKSLFKDRAVKKTYTAIVYGVPKEKNGEINLPIARSASFRRQVAIQGTARWKGSPRAAQTLWKVIAAHTNFSMLEISPKTGRMHQIRVHLAAIGHPVVGDRLYGTKKTRASAIAPRQLLHASEISFVLFGKKYRISVPMPKDMKDFFTK